MVAIFNTFKDLHVVGGGPFSNNGHPSKKQKKTATPFLKWLQCPVLP